MECWEKQETGERAPDRVPWRAASMESRVSPLPALAPTPGAPNLSRILPRGQGSPPPPGTPGSPPPNPLAPPLSNPAYQTPSCSHPQRDTRDSPILGIPPHRSVVHEEHKGSRACTSLPCVSHISFLSFHQKLQTDFLSVRTAMEIERLYSKHFFP